MKVALIARSTLYEVRGGITIQVVETARYLQRLGVDATIHLANEKINYQEYDLLHFFDVIRPANILYHIERSNKPFVITPILINYSEYDKRYRRGVSGFIFRLFSADTNEYLKTILRWILRKDSLQSKKYLWKGQRRSIKYILKRAAMVLPNSEKEYRQLENLYHIRKPYSVIPNGIDSTLFHSDDLPEKDTKLVICAARIEGIKNQLNLIKGLANSEFRLVLIGSPAPNQKKYFQRCKEIAGSNVEFVGQLSHEQLVNYYKKAKVHVLPSWFETCGLSSLEAAALGCNIVITNKGFTREYFGDDAFYCDPGDPQSILDAIKQASEKPFQKKLQDSIFNNFTWEKAATKTIEAYKKIL